MVIPCVCMCLAYFTTCTGEDCRWSRCRRVLACVKTAYPESCNGKPIWNHMNYQWITISLSIGGDLPCMKMINRSPMKWVLLLVQGLPDLCCQGTYFQCASGFLRLSSPVSTPQLFTSQENTGLVFGGIFTLWWVEYWLFPPNFLVIISLNQLYRPLFFLNH